jgi:hypothetical protein
MPDVSPPQLMVYVGIAGLIAWRVYSRMRRLMGRQKINVRRAWSTVVLFPVLLAFLLPPPATQPLSAAALAGGTGLGVVLGVYSLHVTRFEVEPAGLFYTPSAHVGIALSTLVVARIVYRLVQLPFATAPGQVPPAQFVRSPLTLLLIGMLAAYYVTYAIGLIRWHRRATALPASKTAASE